MAEGCHQGDYGVAPALTPLVSSTADGPATSPPFGVHCSCTPRTASRCSRTAATRLQSRTLAGALGMNLKSSGCGAECATRTSGFFETAYMRQVLPGWLTSFYPGRTTTDSTSSRSTVGCAQLRQHEARAPRCVTNVLLSLVASTAARAVAVFPLYVGEVWSITNSLFRGWGRPCGGTRRW